MLNNAHRNTNDITKDDILLNKAFSKRTEEEKTKESSWEDTGDRIEENEIQEMHNREYNTGKNKFFL